MVRSMARWQGKIAIVTGASAGIGAAIAQKLVEEGLQVVGLARRSEKIEELSRTLQDKRGKLHAVRTDMTKEEDILAAFKWVQDNLGPVHILVNNAGIMYTASLTDGETEKWKRTFDINVLALCIATREAVKIMRSNHVDGHIVHINSLAGHGLSSSPGLNVYGASKCAVTALTETLRQELNRLGTKIKITSVSPGATASEFIFGHKLDAQMEAFVKTIAFLDCEDVADAVLYALSTPPHVQVHELTLRSIEKT